MKNSFLYQYDKFNSHKFIKFLLSLLIVVILFLPLVIPFIPTDLINQYIPYSNLVLELSGQYIFLIIPYLLPLICTIMFLYYKDYYLLKILSLIFYGISLYYQYISVMDIHTSSNLNFLILRYIAPNIIFILLFIIIMIFKSKALKSSK
ncbi:hypothetical protein [Miniphocaeibacter halophilus]|uniref:Uncharacterized protein n=1 Tax=Miniphocaeibacter halophilus TaxID=2931922 RepID=A0AC61MY28_9FIRM|nr:hypothetical protein [Miniphocaeibacter halophilus]QQK08386.1 hypothetical protein JFY71_02250 [Miniphocaeibacter halophilus]